MKKTIAILLVLVIGMVGVWAATADLFVKTTVPAINEMLITTVSDNIPWVTDPVTGTQTSSYTSQRSAYASAAVVTITDTTAQSVGFLNVRTNERTGITVKVSAAALEYTVSSTLIDSINYTVGGGSNDYVVGTTAAAVDYLTISSGTTLRDAQKEVTVTLAAGAVNKTAGEYVGSITFEYIVNT